MALTAHSSIISAQPNCTSQESPTERQKTEHQTERQRIEHRRTGRRRTECQKYLTSNITHVEKSIKTKRQ
jgi:hypothetical protein